MLKNHFDSLATIKSLEITDLFCWLLKKGEEFGKRIAEWIKNADYCKGIKNAELAHLATTLR
ncbi:hypothetical protein [Daejeonella sp.]|jgi:hypothetical protein|uniref:hypothetical protein n=1 Tax=Daejeonella sp. TaxID=2805397 RepID=UPI0037BFF143